MRIVKDSDFETTDDAAVELLLAEARTMAQRIEELTGRPMPEDCEELRATVEPEVAQWLKAARELAQSHG